MAQDLPFIPPPSPPRTPEANDTTLADSDLRWIEEYPGEAGSIYGTCKTTFNKFRINQKEAGLEPWAPFSNQAEWELAEWLMKSGVSQEKIDSFLKLEAIRDGAKPAFHNAHSLFKAVDKLPSGPEWICDGFELKGDELDGDREPRTQWVEIWRWDPVKCVQMLLENPFIGEKNATMPIKVYRDEACTNREYGETNTGDWWWETQGKLPPGATIVPVILSSDKTSLTNFSGNKQAYPVYVAIGTTESEIRRQPSAHAMLLIGYIPVSKLEIFSPERRSIEGYQLFHDCMEKILAPLIKAGKDGVKMRFANGFIQKAYLIVAAYIADYPEQCLVVGCQENACPICTVPPKKHGDPVHSVPCDPDKTLRTLAQAAQGLNPKAFKDQCLCPINPFWHHLPHCNMFECITPDVLHQLHKGVFKDHIVSWAMAAVLVPKGEKEFQVHTDETLMQMDLAWVAFHGNKKIFEDLAIRKHFNISKIHNIKHYLDSIRLLGSAAGYNTEATERLHIDLAKSGYQVSNTKDGYTQQMTVWLRRQEAVTWFRLYLQWVMPGYTASKREEAAAEEVEEPASDEEEEGEELKLKVQDQTTFDVAKKPPLHTSLFHRSFKISAHLNSSLN
ncbi:hypothetical protein DXG01_006054 [Tephrocybe rancida]|nr:hypothetical protein DXG01_006054 [Tephrocybe rancida]